MNSFIFQRMNRKYNKYDLYKDIAFITMIIDHIGFYLLPQFKILRLIGRISAVIYAILFGMTKHKNKNRIITFAIITSIVQAIFIGIIFPLNIFYNFYISSFLLDYLYDIYNKYPYLIFGLFLPVLFPLGVITDQITEYGIFFLGFMLCGKIFIKEKKTIQDKLLTLLIFLVYSFYPTYNFKFNIVSSIILFIAFMILYFLMFNFKFDEIKNVKYENSLLFISRYSMELFLAQTILFQFILRVFVWQY